MKVEGKVAYGQQTDKLCCNRIGDKAAAEGSQWLVKDSRVVVPSHCEDQITMLKEIVDGELYKIFKS